MSAPSTTLISNMLTGKRPANTAREETMMVWSPCKPRRNGGISKILQPTLHQINREHLKEDDGSLALGTFRINGAGLVIQKPVKTSQMAQEIGVGMLENQTTFMLSIVLRCSTAECTATSIAEKDLAP